MNNVQFYSLLSGAAASVVTIMLAWMQTNTSLTRLEQTTDSRFARLEASTDAGFRDMKANQEVLARDLREFYRVLGKVEAASRKSRVAELSK